MLTLQATHDIRKVSLWLGHADIKSTEIYLRADPSEKLETLTAGKPLSLWQAKALCIHFSLVQTAKDNGLERDLLESLANCQTVEDYEQLLLWNTELEAGDLKKAA